MIDFVRFYFEYQERLIYPETLINVKINPHIWQWNYSTKQLL